MEPSGPRAVLFDLDGVLTPTADLHMAAWGEVFSDYFSRRGVDAYTDADYFEYLDGKPRLAGIGSLLASRGIELPEGDDDDPATAETISGLGTRKNETFLSLLEEGIEPYPGSVAYLDHLAETGAPMAVVSSSKNAPRVLESAGLASRFEVVVDGQVAADRGIPGKPAPDTYEYAARLLELPTDHCVVVEDATSGVAAGAAGDFALVVGVDRGAGRDALLAAGADTVVGDLADLIESGDHDQEADA